MFKGSCVALVTPMKSQDTVDENALIDLVEWHIQQGTQAIVVAGTTGESATLTPEEQHRVISLVYKTAKKRIPIIAGTGTNSTATTISHTLAAQEIGVDACLVVTPYYNRPTQTGLIQHYSAVAEAVDVPIILYNVPTRTACDMQPETVAVLSEISNIIGIKEATGNLQRLAALKEKCKPGFKFYSGDDPTALEFMRLGGLGVISITANVVPDLMQRMCHLAITKALDDAKIVDDKLQPLHQMLIVEPNPIPVKWALHQTGKIANEIRLPLTQLSIEHHDKMKQALQIAGL